MPGCVPQRQTAAPRFRRAGGLLQSPQSRRVDECDLVHVEIDACVTGVHEVAQHQKEGRCCHGIELAAEQHRATPGAIVSHRDSCLEAEREAPEDGGQRRLHVSSNNER